MLENVTSITDSNIFGIIQFLVMTLVVMIIIGVILFLFQCVNDIPYNEKKDKKERNKESFIQYIKNHFRW